MISYNSGQSTENQQFPYFDSKNPVVAREGVYYNGLMHIYVLHIKTGDEIKIRELIKKTLSDDFECFCPMRELLIRKKGKTKKQMKAMFPGYLFLRCEQITTETLVLLKSVRDFYQVLPNNREMKSIPPKDMDFLKKLFNKDYTAPLSKARFNEKDMIEIISGPLKGKEGMIIKIDKRKGRAKIIVNAFDHEHTVDLGFELMGEKKLKV